MTVRRVEIEDYRVFKGKFAVGFCEGINVIIGGNGTGKTTLLRIIRHDFLCDERCAIPFKYCSQIGVNVIKDNAKITSNIFIPEKDILEHAKGLLPFIEQKETGFSSIYRDVLISAQDTPTKEQSEMQQSIGQKIVDIIGGTIEWVQSEGTYYTVKTDGNRIPFSDEASGFKKFGYLGLLVASGQLSPGTVLFWDEPENSLNPELVPELVDILLELSRNGVQIFIATNSELLASYFAVNRKNSDDVQFISLFKDGEQIKADVSDRFDLLEPNNLTAQPVELYKKEIERGLG